MARAVVLLPLRQRGALFGGIGASEYSRARAAHAHIGVWRDGLQGFVHRFDFGRDDEGGGLHVVGQRRVCINFL